MLHLLWWIHSLAASVHTEVASVAWLTTWPELTTGWPALVIAYGHHGVALVVVVVVRLVHPWLAYLAALAIHASLTVVVASRSTAAVVRVLILRSTVTTHEVATRSSRAAHLTSLCELSRADKACRRWLASIGVVARCATLSCIIELDWACQNKLALHLLDRSHGLLMVAEAEEAITF